MGKHLLSAFICLFIAVSLSASTFAQASAGDNSAPQTGVQHVDRKDADTGARWNHDVSNASVTQSAAGEVKVTVDANKVRNIVGPRAFGIHTSVYDNKLIDPAVVGLLRAAAINTLRYPGGGYADQYHWSTYKATKFQAKEPPEYGYYNPNNNFGNFALLLDYVGTAIVTVNYGSNLAGTGGGEPAEAAAWVAYSNGDPADSKQIGKDSTGYDWKTVGYWASLRAAQPIAEDDGLNFLRIGHAKPMNINYWEIGNEVFGNGYYERDQNGGYEEDLHASYSANPKDSDKTRHHNPALSPVAYGKGVVEYLNAMKAVDPTIKIGAVLNSPGVDTWGPDWNASVLKECGTVIDFAVLHWYPGSLLPPDWKVLDEGSLLRSPEEELPKIISGLLELFHKYGGANSQKLQFLITEMGSKPFAKISTPVTQGLFAADAYTTLMEMGAANIDWLELHGNYFLDEKNVQGPAYYGIQMVHLLTGVNDSLLETRSNSGVVAAHAAKRTDGSAAVMLINKDPKNKANVKIQLNGVNINKQAIRFDWGADSPRDKYPVVKTDFALSGNSFSITIPPYTVTNIVIPAAK